MSWTPGELNALMRSYQEAAVLRPPPSWMSSPVSPEARPPPGRSRSGLRATCAASRSSWMRWRLCGSGEERRPLFALSRRGGSVHTRRGVHLPRDGTAPGELHAQVGAACERGQDRPPGEAHSSVRGAAGDRESFIAAMNNTSAPVADAVVRRARPVEFCQLLDIGGASGHLDDRVPSRMSVRNGRPLRSAARHSDGPTAASEPPDCATRPAVPGDFTTDPLPAGSRSCLGKRHRTSETRARKTRGLFAKVFTALAPGGSIVIRDILMDENAPLARYPCLFAVNMLVGTKGGGTSHSGSCARISSLGVFAKPPSSTRTRA